jgi:hypothetical protein
MWRLVSFFLARTSSSLREASHVGLRTQLMPRESCFG